MYTNLHPYLHLWAVFHAQSFKSMFLRAGKETHTNIVGQLGTLIHYILKHLGHNIMRKVQNLHMLNS